MGRIFGAVLTGAETGSSRTPHAMVVKMSGAAGRLAKGAQVSADTGDERIALGLSYGPGKQAHGIWQEEHGRYIVSFCGFMPGLDDLFEKSGIERGKDPGAGMIALYRKVGPAFISMIPGMFAAALYDGVEKKLIVAGDRSGYFPVYYSRLPDGFVFSSSLRAIVSLIGKPAVDRGALAEYLFFDSLYGSGTVYSDVKILPYGKYFILDAAGGSLSTSEYFSYEGLFDIRHYEENRRINAPAALTSIMKRSLGRIMGSGDCGTFGLLCGGGIDCSYVGGVLREMGMSVPILCSSVADVAVSEEAMARSTVERLGAGFHVAHLTAKNYYPRLLRSILDFGQPIAHPNLARFYVSASNALSHDRPDEILGVASDLLFGGQGNVRSFYKYLKTSKYLSVIPRRFRKAIAAAAGSREAADLELRLRNPLESLVSIGMGNLERGAARAGIVEALGGIRDERERALKILMLENLCDYQQPLLNRRCEMAELHGIALWFPFLDIELVTFAVNLPVSRCVDWNTSKKVVREAARPYLGSSLASRSKWGGDVPAEKWVKPLKFFLEDGFVESRFGFDKARLGPVLDRNIKLLWNLLDIELWGRMCVIGEDPRDIVSAIIKNGLESDPFESVELPLER